MDALIGIREVRTKQHNRKKNKHPNGKCIQHSKRGRVNMQILCIRIPFNHNRKRQSERLHISHHMRKCIDRKEAYKRAHTIYT